MKNYYSILEIGFNATDADIKKAYRQCALKYHPDVNKSTDAHSKFLEVFEAYEVLSNVNERKIYDELYTRTYLHKEVSLIIPNDDYKQRSEANKKRASQKAETYSKMSYSSFTSYLNKELNLALGHVFPIGWAIFLLVEGVASVLLIIMVLTTKELSSGEGAVGGVLILAAIGIGFFAWGWSQFEKAKKNYLEDRRQTFK